MGHGRWRRRIARRHHRRVPRRRHPWWRHPRRCHRTHHHPGRTLWRERWRHRRITWPWRRWSRHSKGYHWRRTRGRQSLRRPYWQPRRQSSWRRVQLWLRRNAATNVWHHCRNTRPADTAHGSRKPLWSARRRNRNPTTGRLCSTGTANRTRNGTSAIVLWRWAFH